MKYIATIFFFIITVSSYSQYASKQYVDSLYHSLDSVVLKPTKTTFGSGTVILDTLTIANNTSAIFQLSIYTDSDATIKTVYVRNTSGVYQVIDDYDVKPFSHNRSSRFLSSNINYQITSAVINNKVIISAIGQSGKVINWTLSRSVL